MTFPEEDESGSTVSSVVDVLAALVEVIDAALVDGPVDVEPGSALVEPSSPIPGSSSDLHAGARRMSASSGAQDVEVERSTFGD